MNAQKSSGWAWSIPVTVAEIPEAGQHLDIVADQRVREALAQVAGLAALPKLEAGLDLMRQGADGVRLAGRVQATVVQNCVVTLEPVQNEIDETVDLVFLPEAALTPPDPEALSAETDDPPEALKNGVIDVGAVVTEFLLLGIYPYPRKPGAVFEAPAADDPSSHPFAALAALKKGDISK